jgi:hypothetical protein
MIVRRRQPRSKRGESPGHYQAAAGAVKAPKIIDPRRKHPGI